MGTSYNSSPLFVHSMHLNFFWFIIIIIMKVMRTCQGDPWGGVLFALTHFRALHSIANHFPFHLFPFIRDNTHIIGPPSIVSYVYEYFQTKLRVIGFSIQLQKCITWLPLGLPPNFNTPFQCTTPYEGIRVLGVPLGTLTFTSSFSTDAL